MKGLWEFSLALYDHGGVAAECLRLQDSHGADVNLLLYCCWYATSGRGVLSVEQVAELDRDASRWRAEVVQQLRSVRRLIKADSALNTLPGAEEARAAVLEAELSAEKVAQQRLESISPPARPDPADPDQCQRACVASLENYLVHLDVTGERRACEALAAAARITGTG